MIGRLAIALTVAAEALAVYTLAEWAAAGSSRVHEAVPGILFVAVALAAFGLLRGLEELDLPRVANAAVAAAATFVALYAPLRLTYAGDLALWNLSWVGDAMTHFERTAREGGPEIIAAMLLIGVWIRTSFRAGEDIELELVPRSLGIPFIAVTAMVVIGAASDRSGEIARAGVAFYGVAVLALACSQLALSGATFGDLRAGGITASLLGGTAGVTVACVVVFGALFGFAGPIIGPILGRAVELVLTVLLTPVAWVVEQILRLLLSNAHTPDIVNNARDAANQSRTSSGHDTSLGQRIGVYVMRAVALAVILGGTALLVAWFMRRRRHPRAGSPSAGERGGAGGLASDLRSLFRRGGHDRSAPADGSTPARRLYLEALERAARSGHPREPAVTPEEFAPRLALHTPVSGDITSAFQQSRYAGREPDEATVTELRHRWQTSRRDS